MKLKKFYEYLDTEFFTFDSFDRCVFPLRHISKLSKYKLIRAFSVLSPYFIFPYTIISCVLWVVSIILFYFLTSVFTGTKDYFTKTKSKIINFWTNV